MEVSKTNHEKENKNKELELTTLKNKIKTLEINSGGSKKLTDIKKEYQEKLDRE